MSDGKGGLGSFPWASAAVLVAFVASTQLVPRAFEPLRPAEKARAQAPLDADLEINARLWEDPFAALRRYELERTERCGRQHKAEQAPDGDCTLKASALRDPHGLLARLDADHNRTVDDTLIVLALMPGADFVGAEEARRRIRYATLAGLLAQDYVPDNAERLSLLEFKLKDTVTDNAGPGFMVPYELLSLRRADDDEPPSRYAQVALLWVDETSLPLRKLDAVARLTEQLMGDAALEAARLRLKRGVDTARPKLAVIGPSSTDALRTALRDLRCAADLSNRDGISRGGLGLSDALRCARPGEQVTQGLPDKVLKGYQLLAKAEFYNPSSTAPERMLPELQGRNREVTRLDDGVDAFLTQQFSRLTRAPSPPPPVRMVRTVGSDADLIDHLVGELQLRLPGDRRRIVVVAERDSIYAQALVGQLRDCLAPHLRDTLEVIYFFRGIDGATTKDASAAANPGQSAAKAAPLEWPESRDQLDYLRRLGSELKRSESAEHRLAIGAIGIFANDVHDKLLVLQALHENFSDRMFFTTDMDARYLHPRTQSFTRNLVVASSLPLSFYPSAPGEINLQAGTPPLRDIYQTSTYAAARRAGCRSEACKQAEASALDAVLKRTSLYEIGRTDTVALSGYALQARPPQGSAGRVFVALLIVAAFSCALFVWPSTPAMRGARAVLLARLPGASRLPLPPTAIVLVALHGVLLSYALASLIEFVWPGHMDFSHAHLLAALAASGALAVALTGWWDGERRRLAALLVLALVSLAAAWVWLAWPLGGWTPGRVCETCEPAVWLEGVSAWPSHLLHLMALFALLWTLDWAWADSQQQLRRTSDWLHLPRPSKPGSLLRLLRHWFSTASVLFWKPGVGYSCDVKQLWIEYGERGEATPRAVRTLFWYGVTLFAVGLLYLSLSDGLVPEVPARGASHRSLVTVTLYATMLLLPLLIVAVADATLLLTRFVRHLNAGRSFYPDDTIESFARSLGQEHAGLWSERFNARPEERSRPGGFAVHTLLDDWIDVQLVAQRSGPVARLVIGPFIVLALLVVARSRLFDNWALTPAIAVGVSFYVAALIGLTLWLKQSAESTRRRAVASMQADLRWLAGSGKPRADLVEPFKRLIAQVENEQQGAFASFFDQPLLKAMLVPLGGAGGTQLFDYLLLGR